MMALFVKFIRISTLLLVSIVYIVAFYRINSNDTIVDSSLEALLPKMQFNEEFNYFRKSIGQELVFLIGAEPNNLAETKVAHQQLQQLLQAYPNITIDPGIDAKMQRYYFAHRYAYVDPPLKATASYQEVSDFVANGLYSFIGGYTEYELQHDPFLTMRRFISESNMQLKMDSVGLPYVHRNGLNYYFIRGRITTPFDNATRAQFFYDIVKLNNDLAIQQIKLLATGEVFFTHSATANSMDDMSRISLVSIVVLVLLLLLVYRSVVPLFLTLLVLGISLSVGVCGVLAIFGSIHAMTFALGSCLIGICVDYCIHVFGTIDAKVKSNDRRAKLFLPLLFSLLTSLSAYLVVVFTDLIVLKQLACFALFALITTFLLCFGFLTSLRKSVEPDYTLARIVLTISKKLPKQVVIYAGVIGVCSGVWALVQMHIDNDVAHMQDKDLSLTRMNEQVQEIITGYKNYANYLVGGESLELALVRCEQIRDSLSKEERLHSFFPCTYMPSKARQAERVYAYNALWKHLEQSYNELNLTSIIPQKPVLTESLTYKDYPGALSGFFGERSVMIRVNADNKALIARLDNSIDVARLDVRNHWSAVFAQYNEELMKMLLIAFVIASVTVALVLGRYIISCFVTPLLVGASMGMLGCIYFANNYFNLFTTMALFMLLGLGADYCIFMARAKYANVLSLLESIIVACLTTLSSFGALAFSNTAIMSSFGMVLGCGLPFIAIFAILMRITLRKEEFL